MIARRTCYTFIFLLFPLLPSGTVAMAAPPQVNGRLERVGPFRLLRVWGTPEEMGYAHGFLVGKDYLAGAEEYARNVPAEVLKRDKRLRKLIGAAQLPESARQEINGIFDGIVAAVGKTPVFRRTGRRLRPDDLFFDNAYDFYRAFACSGFTVWGDKAGDMGLITSRNFDFVMPGPVSLGNQMILVREPTGKSRVATITWPGYIGAFTGVNEHGVCAFVHDGDGSSIRKPKGKYTPVLLVLKELLETASPADAQARAETMIKKLVPYPYSYLLRIVTPRVGAAHDGHSTHGTTDKPVRVFRIDASGLSDQPVASLSCITTNHYLDQAFSAKKNASQWTVHRYGVLKGRVASMLTQRAAWDALRAVGRGSKEGGTLHSLVVYPERRMLDLGMATWKNGISPAAGAPPTRITFDQLFPPGD